MNIIKPGDRYGRLVVIKATEKRRKNHIVFECLCDCGEHKDVMSIHLTQGHVKSCGCLLNEVRGRGERKKAIIRKESLAKIGIKIHRLTLIGIKKEIRKPTIALLQCECGRIVERNMREYCKGRIKSCGCLRKEISVNSKQKKELLKIKKREEVNQRKRDLYIPSPDYTGKRRGSLTVLYLYSISIGVGGNKYPHWYCKCDCGHFAIRSSHGLKGENPSCNYCYAQKRGTYEQKISALSVAYNKLEAERQKKRDAGWIPRPSRKTPKKLKKTVLEKYSFKCVICGKTHERKEPLHTHHLKAYSEYPSLRNTLSNNILLCERCHENLHKTLGSTAIPISKQVDYVVKQRQLEGVTTHYPGVAFCCGFSI